MFADGLDSHFQQIILVLAVPAVAAHVEIAHQALALFQHIVEVRDGLSVFHQSVAAERVKIDKTADQVGGLGEVPVQGFSPVVGFLLQQRMEVVRGEIAQVDELGLRGRGMQPCSHQVLLLYLGGGSRFPDRYPDVPAARGPNCRVGRSEQRQYGSSRGGSEVSYARIVADVEPGL